MARLGRVYKLLIKSDLSMSLFEGKTSHWFIYSSRPQLAGGHREAGTPIA